MSAIEKKSRLRREQDILDRIENVKRLIQMETTLLTAEGAGNWSGYCMVDRKGQLIGSKAVDNLLHDLRDTIQLQLLSITALCYGDNPDVGEAEKCSMRSDAITCIDQMIVTTDLIGLNVTIPKKQYGDGMNGLWRIKDE